MAQMTLRTRTETRGSPMPDRILIPLTRYLAAVLDDGDYLNDWLTHLPVSMIAAVQTLGELIARIAGG
jgi:hypothetical protein